MNNGTRRFCGESGIVLGETVSGKTIQLLRFPKSFLSLSPIYLNLTEFVSLRLGVNSTNKHLYFSYTNNSCFSFFSSLIYFAEKDAVAKWSFMDSFWWGLMVLTTVGYGARAPHTAAGQVRHIICHYYYTSLISYYTYLFHYFLWMKQCFITRTIL